MFKFSSEPGPRPGASGQLRQKFFNDFGRLTTSSLPCELEPHHTHVGRSRHLHAARLRPALRPPLWLAASASVFVLLYLPVSASVSESVCLLVSGSLWVSSPLAFPGSLPSSPSGSPASSAPLCPALTHPQRHHSRRRHLGEQPTFVATQRPLGCPLSETLWLGKPGLDHKILQ